MSIRFGNEKTIEASHWSAVGSSQDCSQRDAVPIRIGKDDYRILARTVSNGRRSKSSHATLVCPRTFRSVERSTEIEFYSEHEPRFFPSPQLLHRKAEPSQSSTSAVHEASRSFRRCCISESSLDITVMYRFSWHMDCCAQFYAQV